MSGIEAPDQIHVPQGELLRSRVVDDIADTLAAVLDRGLTGYTVLEPAGSLLLDDEATGVLTFESGVPVVAYQTSGEGPGLSRAGNIDSLSRIGCVTRDKYREATYHCYQY